MKHRSFEQEAPRHLPFRSLKVALATCACVALVAGDAAAQLAPNQTNGFGNGRLVTFTYLQNFDCVDQPTMDLDFNHILAQSDPNEMQTPICQAVTEPTEDPTGGDLKHTAHLYVLIPFFTVDGDRDPSHAMDCPDVPRPGELCGVALGNALISTFGFLPEAWKKHVNPAITTQCPDPNNPVAGTCDALLFGRSLRDHRRADEQRPPHVERLRADAESQSRGRQLAGQHGPHLVGGSPRPRPLSERLALGRRKQRHHLVAEDGRCRECAARHRGRLEFLPVFQLGNERSHSLRHRIHPGGQGEEVSWFRLAPPPVLFVESSGSRRNAIHHALAHAPAA